MQLWLCRSSRRRNWSRVYYLELTEQVVVMSAVLHNKCSMYVLPYLTLPSGGAASARHSHTSAKASAPIIATWADWFSWCCWRWFLRFIRFIECPLTLPLVPASHFFIIFAQRRHLFGCEQGGGVRGTLSQQAKLLILQKLYCHWGEVLIESKLGLLKINRLTSYPVLKARPVGKLPVRLTVTVQ